MAERLPSPSRASEWRIALQEAPGDELLRARFRAWLAASPAHARDWQEIDRIGALLGQLEEPNQQGPRKWQLHIAGAAALAACLVLAFMPAVWRDLRSDYRTGTGEQKTVQLADGSLVQLAPRSAIAATPDGRSVELLQGEAFFTVRHDPARRFTVRAGDVETTDLGTEFDVRKRGDDVAVGVRQGLVSARPAWGQPSQLRPGEALHFGGDHAIIRQHLPAQSIGAWTRGQFVVRDRPAGEVVEALRPYFPGFIVIKDSGLADQRLTGVFDLSDPTKALRAIAALQGGKVYRVSPWILVLTSG